MPADTPDQQITYPVDADAADNPVDFLAMLADVEPRLQREYTTEADRTTRMTALSNGDLSVLTAPSVGSPRTEVYDGTNHISLQTRSFFAFVRKTSNEVVNNSTTLQDDNALLAALPTAGTFAFELDLVYSASTVADFKMAFTIPAGASITWWGFGLVTGVSSMSGDIQFMAATASGTSASIGGAGTGNFTSARIAGEVVMGGTAGNLQLQWAQANLEATDATVRAPSRLMVWRVV